MHHELTAGAPNLSLQPGMILRLEARSPTTDAAVGGVTAAQWMIYGYDEGVGAMLLLDDEIPDWVALEVLGVEE